MWTRGGIHLPYLLVRKCAHVQGACIMCNVQGLVHSRVSKTWKHGTSWHPHRWVEHLAVAPTGSLKPDKTSWIPPLMWTTLCKAVILSKMDRACSPADLFPVEEQGLFLSSLLRGKTISASLLLLYSNQFHSCLLRQEEQQGRKERRRTALQIIKTAWRHLKWSLYLS